VVDTSLFQSTKTLGHAKQKRTDVHALIAKDLGEQKSESDGNESWDDETLEPDIPGDSKDSLPPTTSISEHLPVILGSALKRSDVESSEKPTTKRRKRNDKPSWRERLEQSRKPRNDDISSQSDDDEFSDWSGISSSESVDGGNDDEDGNGKSRDGEEDELDEVSESEDEESSSDSDGDTKQRAKNFKDWAREKSGLGPSVSNISGLPTTIPDSLKPKISIQNQVKLRPNFGSQAEKREPVTLKIFILSLILGFVRSSTSST